MKVLAIMGSPRKGQTDRVVQQFAQQLLQHGNIEFSYIYLRDMKLQPCSGCGICLMRGEEYCPHKDDREFILDQMAQADGVIFATPNYSLQVSGLLKTLLDRLAFVFHRPCFFHKKSMVIITQGVYGGKDIVKYLNTVGEFWGFQICPGLVLTTPWGVVKGNCEWPEEEANKIKKAIVQSADRFYKHLKGSKSPAPSLKRLALFRFVRSAHKYSKEKNRDYKFFQDNGWFETPYFYDTKLSWFKRMLGDVIDYWLAKQAKKAAN